MSIFFNITSCTECKLCHKACPLLPRFTNSSKELLFSLEAGEDIQTQMIFTCTDCNYCTTVCPEEISFRDIFYNYKNLLSANSEILKEIDYKRIKFHQDRSFSQAFKAIGKKNNTSHIAFMPGCSLSAHSLELVKSIHVYLGEIFKDITLVQHCCSKPTKTLGHMGAFKQYYEVFQQDIQKAEIKELIVACQNCYMTIKEHSKDLRVHSLYEVLAKHGVPKNLQDHYKKSALTFALHDPCPTRDETKLQDAVRNILEQLGVRVEEFRLNKNKTSCCGKGGMLAVTNPKVAKEHMQERAMQARSLHIASYCQSCVDAMSEGGKIGVHVLDFLFNPDFIQKGRFKQTKRSGVGAWWQRYRTKRYVDSL